MAVVAPNRVLPERLEDGDLLLRRWLVDDAEILGRAVDESAKHLRPWMAWASNGPESLATRRTRLRTWEREWLEGGDVVLGVFLDGEVAGGCGLHRRHGPSVLDIGYWLHPAFTGRGLATRLARLLTAAAFKIPGIAHVEIHHDKANAASSRVPRRLAFRFVAEAPDEATAPAEAGVDCTWRIDRATWLARSASG